MACSHTDRLIGHPSSLFDYSSCKLIPSRQFARPSTRGVELQDEDLRLPPAGWSEPCRRCQPMQSPWRIIGACSPSCFDGFRGERIVSGVSDAQLAEGKCFRGEACSYAHSEEELAPGAAPLFVCQGAPRPERPFLKSIFSPRWFYMESMITGC